MATATLDMVYERLGRLETLLAKLAPLVEVVATPPELVPERMEREDRELIGLQRSLSAADYTLHYATVMSGRLRAMGQDKAAEGMMKRAEAKAKRLRRQ